MDRIAPVLKKHNYVPLRKVGFGSFGQAWLVGQDVGEGKLSNFVCKMVRTYLFITVLHVLTSLSNDETFCRLIEAIPAAAFAVCAVCFMTIFLAKYT